MPVTRSLELLETFVNTRDLDRGSDLLSDGQAATHWLAEHDLAPADETFGDRDATRLRAVREGLRALALANNGATPDPAALEALTRESERAPLAVRVDGGRPALAPAGDGIAVAIGRLLAIAAGAQADGCWPRFKACPDDTCQWAFFDESRNRSRSWCSMEVCGNRHKARAYRERAQHRD